VERGREREKEGKGSVLHERPPTALVAKCWSRATFIACDHIGASQTTIAIYLK
jgi:hypothetical protein